MKTRKNTMFRSHLLIATYFAVGALAFAPAVKAAANAEEESSLKIVDLAPFTHLAYIPVGADLSSIRFKAIKALKIATKQRSVTNPRYCNEERLAVEPGGSMYCPLTADESFVPAYQVTYMFTAPPMPSDEYGSTQFTFSVYFRWDEISPNLREALSSGKLSHSELSEYFQVTTLRESMQQTVIDEANSTICEGNYVDGNWTHTNPNCQDRIAYKKYASASPYMTVRIELASRLEANAPSAGN